MKQSFASAARLRGGGPILTNGSMTMFGLGSPPPRIVSGQPGKTDPRQGCRNFILALLDCEACWSGRLPQHHAVWDLTGGDHAPERDEQLAAKSDDHLGLVRPFDALGPAPEPLRQSAVLLEQQEAPSELDQERRTRALPDLARPFSRRLEPLSSGAPVSPA